MVGCRQKLPGRQHHCIIAFTGVSVDIDHPRALPCSLGSCHVSLIIGAHNRRAVHGDKLVIGSHAPSGRIFQDKGRINAIRLRAGSQPPPPTLETRRRRHTRVPLDQTPTVALSQRIRRLKKNTQLAVVARMRTDVSMLPTAHGSRSI
jgi:hypothetical protein